MTTASQLLQINNRKPDKFELSPWGRKTGLSLCSTAHRENTLFDLFSCKILMGFYRTRFIFFPLSFFLLRLLAGLVLLRLRIGWLLSTQRDGDIWGNRQWFPAADEMWYTESQHKWIRLLESRPTPAFWLVEPMFAPRHIWTWGLRN